MTTDREQRNGSQDPQATRSSILLRGAVAYLIIGAALAQGALLLIRGLGFSPVLFQAVLVLLFLGLPVVMVGIMALEGRFGPSAATHAMDKSVWTSAPMVLILGAVVLLAGAGGWDMLPGPLNPLGPLQARQASLGFLPPQVFSSDPGDASQVGTLSRRVRSALTGVSGITVLPDSLIDLYRSPTPTRTESAILLQETFRRAEGGTVLAIDLLDARTGESLWRSTIEGPADGQPGAFSEDEVRGEMDALMTFLEERLDLDLPEVRSP
jgi:hypothetical protein